MVTILLYAVELWGVWGANSPGFPCIPDTDSFLLPNNLDLGWLLSAQHRSLQLCSRRGVPRAGGAHPSGSRSRCPRAGRWGSLPSLGTQPTSRVLPYLHVPLSPRTAQDPTCTRGPCRCSCAPPTRRVQVPSPSIPGRLSSATALLVPRPGTPAPGDPDTLPTPRMALVGSQAVH